MSTSAAPYAASSATATLPPKCACPEQRLWLSRLERQRAPHERHGSTIIHLESSLGRGQCDVAPWRDVVAVAAGSAHTLGLRADGSVLTVGNNDDGQCNTSDWHLDATG